MCEVIVRCGYGHRVERKQEHSKLSTSIMFRGNANRDYLAPMVVYKAKNIYQGRIEAGSAGAVYDATLIFTLFVANICLKLVLTFDLRG